MTTTTTDSNWNLDAKQFPYGGNLQCRYEFMLRYAALAPSGHNSQPWLFRIHEDVLDLYCDPRRSLPVVDPDDRELVISCGAALQHLRLAARNFDYQEDVEILPDEHNHEHLARLSIPQRCVPTEQEKAMFTAIPHRHTCREKFLDKPVPESIVQELRDICEDADINLDVFQYEFDRHELGRLVAEGDIIQGSDVRFRRELASWVHANRTHSEDGMPGYAFGIGDVASLVGPFVVRTFDMGKRQAAKDEQLAEGSPLLIILSTNRDDQTDWLQTGEALAQLLLTLTHHGLSASYLNQPIEISDLRTKLKRFVGSDHWPQILLRVGYGSEVRSTPRRPVSEILVR